MISIPWTIFWLLVVSWMAFLFRKIAREDRILKMVEILDDWSDLKLERYIKNLENYRLGGAEMEGDRELLEAARRVLRLRENSDGRGS